MGSWILLSRISDNYTLSDMFGLIFGKSENIDPVIARISPVSIGKKYVR